MDDLPMVQERLRRARQRAGVSHDELTHRTVLYSSDITTMEMRHVLPTVPR
jgi:ribosome-binding protein aMBF1 (putative translation factor)